jgi:hypothetical protein
MMRTRITRALIACAAAALILGAIPLMAQAPSGQGQAQAPAARTAQGQLMRVDTEAMTLSIQSAQGSPLVFHYTADTKVVGADRGVAGLATMTGSPVAVRYVQQDKDNIAIQIEIQEKK